MKNRKLDYKILECYANEVERINVLLDQLEGKRVYELSYEKEDDSLADVAKKLRKNVFGLLDKIQGGESGNVERLEEILNMIRY